MKKVLVVDDREENVYLLQVLLSHHGYQVETAREGAEALKLARLSPPELLVTDILMPGMDGFELCRQWKQDAQLKAIPLVFYTATYTDPADEQFALELGADAFIVKPAEPDDFMQRIRAVLEITAVMHPKHPRETRLSEPVLFKQYNQVLVHKLEQKLQQLEATESYCHALFDHIPDGILVTDTQGRCLDTNASLCRMLGYPHDALIGRQAAELLMLPEIEGLLTTLERAHNDHHHAWSLRCRDGSTLETEVAVSTLPDGRVLAVIRDISERKQTEQALHASRARLEAALESMSDAVFISDTEGNFTHFNEAFATFHKFKDKQECAKTLAEYPEIIEVYSMEGELLPLERWAVPRALRGESGTAVEFTLKRKDSGASWIGSYNYAPIYDLHGVIAGSVVTGRDVTEQKNMQQALIASEENFRSLAESMPQIVWICDASGWNTYFNRQWQDYTGLTLEESYGHGWNKPFHPDDQQRAWNAWQNAVQHRANYVLECRLRRADGEYLWWLIRGVPVIDENNQIKQWFGTCTDINDIKLAEQELRIAAIAFESQEGMMVTDPDGAILKVNNAFTSITGYAADEVQGKNPRLLQSGRQNREFYQAMWRSLNETGNWQGEVWNRRKNGEIYPEHLAISAVRNQDGAVSHYVGTLADVTMSHAASEEIQRLAFYDALTGLPNRRLLQDRLKQAFASSMRSGKYGALLFIDLDNFKSLNDTLGHDTGDQLLQQIAQRLLACVRENDTVARFGGDEFVVMLEELGLHELEAGSLAESIANKVLANLYQPFQLDSHVYHSSCSIGATLFNQHKLSIDDLLKQADIALYQAKALGKNALCFFNTTMQDDISSRVALENELRNALAKGQFQLYYQLQVDNNGRVNGAEALIRWQHPELNLVAPEEFISLAEDTGMILAIGLWVLDSACAQLAIWQQQDRNCELTLSVNVSARQISQANFVTEVEKILHKHKFNKNRLKLELTESLLLNNVEDTISKMAALQQLGLRFALDDFGIGYSSLQYLKRLPLDELKIDQSFVRDIVTDLSDLAIVRTILAMAQTLNLNVIAEGVESEAQRQLLQQEGCTHYQGYLFGKPMPIGEFEEKLQER